MTGRIYAAGLFFLGLGLGACRSLPATKEEALVNLIEAAVAGQASEDAYAVITPGADQQAVNFIYLETWLDVNAEAVQQVRAFEPAAEGAFRFTQSLDGRVTYLIALGWPGAQVRSQVLHPAVGSKVTLLGWDEKLSWEQLGGTWVLTTPREMADEENHPCTQAFVFRIEAPLR